MVRGDEMGIDIGIANSHAAQLNYSARRLRYIKGNLEDYKWNLNNRWQASEMGYINNAIDELNRELQRLASSLDSLGDDVRQVANEIAQEELARARAEAKAREEAKAKAEAEAKERAAKNS
jgi:uncharacterized protein YukE